MSQIAVGLAFLFILIAIIFICDGMRRLQDKINNLYATMSKLEDQLDQLQAYYEQEAEEQEISRTDGIFH